jgi:hypothetical protein
MIPASRREGSLDGKATRSIDGQTKPQLTVFRLRGTPAQFIGIVDAPDEQAAINKAIEEFKVPANQRDRG